MHITIYRAVAYTKINITMIIILGDSFSADIPNAGLAAQHPRMYPVQQCLRAQLEAATGESVLNFAMGGANDLHQARLLTRCLQENTGHTSPITVVWGWSDWCRILWEPDFPSVNGNFEVQTGSYAGDLALCRSIMRECLDRIDQLLPKGSRVLHWGGQAECWLPGARDHHTVIYSDYTRQTLGSPDNTTGLVTYAARLPISLSELFPLTPKHELEDLVHRTDCVRDWRDRKSRLYPDGIHLAFERYAPLVKTIQEHL